MHQAGLRRSPGNHLANYAYNACYKMQCNRTQPTLRGRLAEALNIYTTVGGGGCGAVVVGAIVVVVGVAVVVVIVLLCVALLLLSTMKHRNMSVRALST